MPEQTTADTRDPVIVHKGERAGAEWGHIFPNKPFDYTGYDHRNTPPPLDTYLNFKTGTTDFDFGHEGYAIHGPDEDGNHRLVDKTSGETMAKSPYPGDLQQIAIRRASEHSLNFPHKSPELRR